MAESIIVMCVALGKSVVAEGVETEAQLEFLRRAGCTTIQGYLVGRPMEASDIAPFAQRMRFKDKTIVPESTTASALRTAKSV